MTPHDRAIIWANGKPWFVIVKTSYVLCGSWNTASYIIGHKTKSGPPVFHIGYALAPPEAVVYSKQDSIQELHMRGFHSDEYPDDTEPLDLIEIAIRGRGSNRTPCTFIVNDIPSSLVLVYQSKQKTDLAFVTLCRIPGWHERVCHDSEGIPDAIPMIPAGVFHDIHGYDYGNPFPGNSTSMPGPDLVQHVDWATGYDALDADGNPTRRYQRRRARESQRLQDAANLPTEPA
ncbi:hypothetical protein N7539_008576 [Penicillium diatomitis]|uniref:Uncharacterized protein n=1 Tax=Penicillium diatomitis TaxID=2819901 RepID=A0A9W9WRM8_9EURO|nr:uncharacterized protein N7539_008576 [Penicillium diatomitis]KAJ5472007.1 hypothetical protein N7539_008576 [Penicillium diatomitis]